MLTIGWKTPMKKSHNTVATNLAFFFVFIEIPFMSVVLFLIFHFHPMDKEYLIVTSHMLSCPITKLFALP